MRDAFVSFTRNGKQMHAARWRVKANAGGFYSLCGRHVHVPVPEISVIHKGAWRVDCESCRKTLLNEAAEAASVARRVMDDLDTFGR